MTIRVPDDRDPRDASRRATPLRVRAAHRGTGRTAAVRLVAATLLALLVALLAAPSAADAHAVLTRATPGPGAELDAVPAQVELVFNEPVAVGEQGLRVFDGEGARVDDGPAETADASIVAVDLPTDLPDGAYVAAYRVVSADDHPIAGTVAFTVGDAAALDDAAVEAIAGVDAGALGAFGSVLRGLGYVAALVAAGAVVFTLTVDRSEAGRRRAAALAVPAAVAGAVVTLIHVPVQTAAVSGFGLLQAATDLEALGATFGSGFGRSAMLRLAALVALAMLWRVRGPRLALAFASLGALGSYLLDGHQRSIQPTWLLTAGDAVHLLGAATWAAGLVLLIATLRAARRDDDPVAAATVVARFSRVALWSVVVLAAAGTAMSFPLVRGLGALTSTTYGWTLLVKVGLVAVIVLVAAYNRQQLVPRVRAAAVPAGGSVDVTPDEVAGRAAATDRAWGQLRRTVSVEAGLVVVVLLVTGFLVSTEPAAEAAGLSGAVYETVDLGDDLTLDFSVDPATPGLNTIHAYAFDAEGSLAEEVDGLRLEFTYLPEQIGPIIVEPFVAGPGHWTANIEDLRFVGEWEVRIVGSIGRFDEVEATLPFNVNR